MAYYTCEKCGARNTRRGYCLICKRFLGSPRKAAWTGGIFSGLYGAFWLMTATSTDTPHTYMAAGYGLIVSFSIWYFAAGNGREFQIIASFMTAVGLALSSIPIIYLYWRQLVPAWGMDEPLPPLWRVFPLLVHHNPDMLLFMALGMISGLWIWKGTELDF